MMNNNYFPIICLETYNVILDEAGRSEAEDHAFIKFLNDIRKCHHFLNEYADEDCVGSANGTEPSWSNLILLCKNFLADLNEIVIRYMMMMA